MTEHEPIDYRPEGESRHTIPGEVCGTCSNLAKGKLVPVSFCPHAKIKSDELYEYLQGGPRPAWLKG